MPKLSKTLVELDEDHFQEILDSVPKKSKAYHILLNEFNEITKLQAILSRKEIETILEEIETILEEIENNEEIYPSSLFTEAVEILQNKSNELSSWKKMPFRRR
uniref:Uncharacterized protein n=1 Tax=viral metagenome TaxID=1070528 RepID=A0A6H1ZXQ1_9ZZZZ